MSDTNLNNASFTPEIQDSEESTNKQTYAATGSFRFWCQKVLPLVYDDSLSYYELLCKVVNYLNSVIQNVDNLNTSVDNTNTAFNNLQNYVNTTKDTLVEVYGELEQYVNDYFNNLDVQEEINSKLDSMAEDGSLSTIISPFIPSAVSAWLAENITPTSPPVDNTLSITGAAADAKVTGDNLTALKSDLGNIKHGYINLYDKNDIDLDKYYSGDGTTKTDRDMFVTNPILLPQRKTLFYDGLTKIYSTPRAVYFDSNRTFITNSAFKELSGKNTLDNIPPNAVYIAFSVDKTDLNTFTFGYDAYADIDNSIEYNQNMIGEAITNENYAEPNGWITGAYIDAINGAVVPAERYSYQYVPFFSYGNYCIYRKYTAFGEKASYVSLHDETKKYVKTIHATSYDQSTGIGVFPVDKDDLVLCKYIGISTLDNETVNVKKGDNYRGGYIPNAWEIDLAKHIKTKLHGGTLICDGDSISYGARDFPLNLHGWFGRLIRDNSMRGENFSVNGATISYQDNSTHCISRSIETIHSNYTADNVDYLMLEGGTNDADIIGRIIEGTIPTGFGTWNDEDFSGNYDDTTFCGAVETLFYKAINYFPKSKIGFIIPMQMGGPSVNVKSIKNRRAYYDEVIKIADKWHIPVLDLWKISTMDARLSVFYDISMTGEQNVTAEKYYYDGQHPTSYGYDFMQDKIQRWAESL